MKYRDIVQYISPIWSTDVSLSYIPNMLKDFEESYHLETNPDFQRGHVWTPEQQSSYLEFLLKGGKSAKEILFNCAEFDGPHRDNKQQCDTPHMVLVDGLQRITAILGFLNNKVPVFDGIYSKDFEDKCKIYLKFSVNNLQTRREILQWYLEINTTGTPHTKEEIQRVRQLYEACP